MEDFDDLGFDFGVNVVDDCLIIKLPAEVNESSIEKVSGRVLDTISQSNFYGVILDFASLTIINSFEYKKLRDLVIMTRMFGISSIIVGMQPGVVSALVDMDIDADGLITLFDLEAGLNYIKNEFIEKVVSDVDESEVLNEYDGSSNDDI